MKCNNRYAITLGSTTDYEGPSLKIENGFKFRVSVAIISRDIVSFMHIEFRVQKNPGFLKPTRPVFLGFSGFYWVFI